jgi:hypothetical protein
MCWEEHDENYCNLLTHTLDLPTLILILVYYLANVNLI